MSEFSLAYRLKSAILSVTGRDALDFLQRLSTNDVLSIMNGHSCATILVNDKAKIVDVVTVLRFEKEVLLIPESGDAGKVQNWLDRFLFSEDVKMRDVSNDYEHWMIAGHDKIKALQKEFNIEVPTKDSISFQNRDNENYFLLYKDLLWQNDVYHLFLNKNQPASAIEEWLKREESTQAVINDCEVIRIEQGIPKFGKELTEQVNPLEAGLERFISWTKGCYIGQEVIARIDTYKKLQRKLSKISFVDGNEKTILPGKLYLNGEEVGWTMSHTWSEREQKNIALGYCRLNLQTDTVEFKNEQMNAPLQAVITPL